MYSMIPYRNSSLFSFMDDLERGFSNSINGKNNFRCDISEKGDQYMLEAELPGFDKKDIGIELDGDMLTISATHEETNDEKDKAGNYVRRERRYGSFSRSFDIEGIDTQQIKADYKNGILELTLPKKKAEPHAEEKRQIPIS